MSSTMTLPGALRDRWSGSRENQALTFVREGGKPATVWTYDELLRRAAACAEHLQQLEVGHGERVLLLHPPGPAFLSAFLGCVLAGALPVPLPHPRQKRSLPRVLSVAKDCSPTLLWTDDDQLETVRTLCKEEVGLKDLRIASSECGMAVETQVEAWLKRAPHTGPVFLQYTSGSTGSPKGVVVTHECLAHQFEALRAVSCSRTRSAFWVPHYHDMGLIGGLLLPIVGAGCIVQMSPAHFLSSPQDWLIAASANKAEDLLGPDFGFALCATAQHPELDLSHIRVAWNGAEPIRASTLDRFNRAFAASGFQPSAWMPCYGMAECTLMATGVPRDEARMVLHLDPTALSQNKAVDATGNDAQSIVSSGRTMAGMRIAIVAADTHATRPDNHVGEIWIQGGSVAAGYWNKPELNAQCFAARTREGDGPFLRTGDLGFLRDGQLYVTGRLKDLIKVRGRNIYPQDLEEAVVAALPGTAANGVAAFALDGGVTEAIGLVVEGDRSLLRLGQRADKGDAQAQAELQSRARTVRKAVTEAAEITPQVIAFVGPGAFPRTTSGKVQRSLARQRLLEGSLEVVYRESAAEREREREREREAIPMPASPQSARVAATVWNAVMTVACEVLSRATGQSLATLPADEPLTAFGLDSLAAVELCRGLEARLDRAIDVELVRASSSLRDLASRIESSPRLPRPAQPATRPHPTPTPSPAASPAGRAAAITGMGVACALGDTPDALWTALAAGRTGTRWATPSRGRPGLVAAVCDDLVQRVDHEALRQPRAVQLAVAAAHAAWTNARFTGHPERVGLVVGTGLGNLDLLEDTVRRADAGQPIAATTAFHSFAHAAACQIASDLDLRGPIQTVSTGCNSGADALATALLWLRAGMADAVLVGGTEAELVPSFFDAMCAARALSTAHAASPGAASRPFDKRRDGNVPGEGAAFVLLENERHAATRGAHVQARLLGFASLAAGRRPTYDPSQPPFDPEPLARTMRAAMADAGVGAAEVVGVSANGSSSVFYDVLEATAIQLAMAERQDRVPVFSIKGALGQTGAVTPVLQAVTAALALKHGCLPPTANADSVDPRCEIDLVRGTPRRIARGPIVCNAIGFGGAYNATTIVGCAT